MHIYANFGNLHNSSGLISYRKEVAQYFFFLGESNLLYSKFSVTSNLTLFACSLYLSEFVYQYIHCQNSIELT